MGSLGDGRSKEGTLEGFDAGEFCSQRAEDCAEVVQRPDLSRERSSPRKGQWQWGWRNKNKGNKTRLGERQQGGRVKSIVKN